jgi:deoxyadenosine/deoxycytidine kinase
MRIEIAGGIASGKTSLAMLLARESGYEVVLERFRENPFWKKFYQQQAKWVEEKNFCFLIQHIAAIKNARSTELICDYAVIQDLAYARLVTTLGHSAMMLQLCNHLYQQLPPPSVLVHLTCSPEVLRARIAARARAEEAGVTINYLAGLNKAISTQLYSLDRAIPIYSLNSEEVNFVVDAEASRRVVAEILKCANQSVQP